MRAIPNTALQLRDFSFAIEESITIDPIANEFGGNNNVGTISSPCQVQSHRLLGDLDSGRPTAFHDKGTIVQFKDILLKQLR